MPPTTVLIASNNRHKLVELSQLLAALPIKLITPAELGLSIDIPETGSTYRENARLKADAFAKRSGLFSLADDSGLEVIALEGWRLLGPHRWARRNRCRAPTTCARAIGGENRGKT